MFGLVIGQSLLVQEGCISVVISVILIATKTNGSNPLETGGFLLFNTNLKKLVVLYDHFTHQPLDNKDVIRVQTTNPGNVSRRDRVPGLYFNPN